MIKIQPKTLTILFLLSTFYFLFSYALSVKAAILYLEPSQGEYHLDETFIVDVKLNTEGEYINAAKVDLNFPKDILEIKDFSKGNSVLIFWVEEPEFSNETGKVSFSGGVPAGYQGWDGSLGKIIFKAHEFTQIGTQINTNIEFLDTSQVLLNDGFGTPAKLTTKMATFTILPERLEVSEDEWQKELEKDKIPPEIFEIEIQQDPLIFDGKYFIIFSTVDKQTGMDYYELREGKKDWKKAESPYLLEDQSLKNIIKVRAVDKAGNERIAEYLPPKKLITYWVIILVLVGIGVIYWIITKLKRNWTRNRR